MTFRELIKLYQAGSLEEKQAEMVKAEIEKHEAISDYLCEVEQLPDPAEMGGLVAEEERNADAFTKTVRKAIRRAFIRMGLVVGCCVIAIVLAVTFLLPDFVSGFYYNPNEVVGTSSSGHDTNRMSLDLAVFSELYLPGKYRDEVFAEDWGYGKYSLTIPQTSSYSGVFTTVAGSLERDKLVLYSPDLLTDYPANAFSLPEDVRWPYGSSGAAGGRERAFEKLQELDENEIYTAYFSLDALTDYETICQQAGMAWYAVYNEVGYEAGFWNKLPGIVKDWDREKYPLLSTLGSKGSIAGIEDNAASEEAMRIHFVSMLKYMQDHPEVLEMFGNTNGGLKETIRYVETKGLKIYGFVIIGDKQTILEMAEAENIYYVYTEPYG